MSGAVRAAVAFALLAACARKPPPDDCERAIARLARIDRANGIELDAATSARLIESCRTGTHAAWDPVVRCAMDSPSDEAAAACIERGIEGVVKTQPSEGGGGSGINPLLGD